MPLLSVIAVICFSYLAGASSIARPIQFLLRNYCPICGTRSDQFVRTAANIIKGFGVVYLGSLFGPTEAQFAALFVFLGHLYPVQRDFKGGNGMAILLGTMIGLNPLLGMIALFSWLFGYFVFRYASLAAILSALATPMGCFYLQLDISIHLLLVFTVIVFWRHRESLARINEGKEDMVVWD